jgi:hypothetical protein
VTRSVDGGTPGDCGARGQPVLEITEGMLGPQLHVFHKRGVLAVEISLSDGLVLVDAPEVHVVATRSLP